MVTWNAYYRLLCFQYKPNPKKQHPSRKEKIEQLIELSSDSATATGFDYRHGNRPCFDDRDVYDYRTDIKRTRSILQELYRATKNKCVPQLKFLLKQVNFIKASLTISSTFCNLFRTSRQRGMPF